MTILWENRKRNSVDRRVCEKFRLVLLEPPGLKAEFPRMNVGAPTIALFSSHGSKRAAVTTSRPAAESREPRNKQRGHPGGWPLSRLYPSQVLERLLIRLEKRYRRGQGLSVHRIAPTSEPPETGRGDSSYKRTASASQPIKGLNCIQKSFSRSDLLRRSLVANLPFR